jgi:antitoxin (DNA-binding transcriptional repressor) of toxin-antitoxin stability system
VWRSRTGTPIARAGADQTLVFTTHDLGRQAARLIREIENSGKPAFITRYGRFIATITPLAPGQVESEVLPEMARQLAKQGHGRPLPSGTSTAGAASRWSRLLALADRQISGTLSRARGRLAHDRRAPGPVRSARASHGGKTVRAALVTRALDNYPGGRATRPAR